MQLSGEEFIRVSRSAGAKHSGDQAGAAAPDTLVSNTVVSGHGAGSRAAWVRLSTAPNVSRLNSKTAVLTGDPVTISEREDIERIGRIGAEIAEVREGVVSSLRERIEAGTYFVGAETIAEMMLRRTLADRLR